MPRRGEGGRTGDTMSYSVGDTKNERGKKLSFPDHDSSGDAGAHDLIGKAPAPELSIPESKGAEKPKNNFDGAETTDVENAGSFNQADILAYQKEMERKNGDSSDKYNPAVGIDTVKARESIVYPNPSEAKVVDPALVLDIEDILAAGKEGRIRKDAALKSELMAENSASEAAAEANRKVVDDANAAKPAAQKPLSLRKRFRKFFFR